MKYIIFFTILCFTLNGDNAFYECSKVFKSKKQEIISAIENINDKQEALLAYQNSANALLDKKKEYISQKETNIEEMLLKITTKEKNIKNLLTENKNYWVT